MVVRESTAMTREARRNMCSMPHGRTRGRPAALLTSCLACIFRKSFWPARHLARVVDGCEKDFQQASVVGIGARQLGVVVGGAQVLRCHVSVEARCATVCFNEIDVFRSRNGAQDAIRTGIYYKDSAGSGRRSPRRTRNPLERPPEETQPAPIRASHLKSTLIAAAAFRLL